MREIGNGMTYITFYILLVSHQESPPNSESNKNIFFIVLIISGALLIFYYMRSISDFHKPLIINNNLNEHNLNKPMDYLDSCLYELLLRKDQSFEPPSGKDEERQNLSICNDVASKRGPHQQIVSFSFYGQINHSRNYFKGIEENAKMMRKIYPQWIMRVYHDIPPLTEVTFANKSIDIMALDNAANSTVDMLQAFYKGLINSPQVKLCILKNIYPVLDLCYVGNISGFGKLLEGQGNIWRFLPMADPLVDVFISRDLDSRLNERERAAVDEWLNSNLTVHVMRDHRGHRREMLAGMWGAVTHKDREKFSNLTRQLMDGGKKYIEKGLDQSLLKDIFWPKVKGKVMQHDSYYCKLYARHGNMQPWPTERLKTPYNFVGARYGVDIHPMLNKCPNDCRPKDKQNWLIC